MRSVFRCLVACALAITTVVAVAQTAGAPVRLILGVAPGGSLDSTTRVLASAMQKILNRPVTVENKPGANMLIATKYVIGSKPDGDTLLLGTSAMEMNPLVYPKESIDPLKDYTPVALVGTVPLMVAVNPALKIDTVQDLIAYAKANPRKLNYSAGTIGFRVAGELFMRNAGIEMNPIPYSGAGPALNAVVAGEVQVTFLDVATLANLVKAGRVKALLVSSPQRSKVLPDVPTSKEAGLAGFDLDAWSGVFAPPQMPAATLATVHQALQSALATAEVGQALAGMGFEVAPGSTADFVKKLDREMAMYRSMTDRVNFQAQ